MPAIKDAIEYITNAKDQAEEFSFVEIGPRLSDGKVFVISQKSYDNLSDNLSYAIRELERISGIIDGLECEVPESTDESNSGDIADKASAHGWNDALHDVKTVLGVE